MPINYDRLDEGDKLDAASINDRLSATGGAAQGVNNLGQADIEKRALRQEHLPSVLTTSDFPNGLVKLAPITALSSAPYINTLNTLATGAVPVPGYQTFDTVEIPNAPYGPALAAATGWRIIADNNITADAGALQISSGNIGNYKGLLVRLSVELVDWQDTASGPWGMQGIATVLGIGWEDNLGRHVVERSVRWYNYFNVVKGSLDLFTVIRASDVGNNNQISKVFGVIASASWGVTSVNYDSPIIRYYNIDVTPVRAGELPNA